MILVFVKQKAIWLRRVLYDNTRFQNKRFVFVDVNEFITIYTYKCL